MAAGQPSKSKSDKRLHLHQQVRVLDLVPVIYSAWQGGRFFLPESKLWTLKPEPSLISRRRKTL